MYKTNIKDQYQLLQMERKLNVKTQFLAHKYKKEEKLFLKQIIPKWIIPRNVVIFLLLWERRHCYIPYTSCNPWASHSHLTFINKYLHVIVVNLIIHVTCLIPIICVPNFLFKKTFKVKQPQEKLGIKWSNSS